MACGWCKGYFGIQELAQRQEGGAVLGVGSDRRRRPEEGEAETSASRCCTRTRSVRVGRFGGEGTGGQSFFDFDWKVGETYRFLVTAAGRRGGPHRVRRATSTCPRRSSGSTWSRSRRSTERATAGGLLLVRRGLPAEQGLARPSAAGGVRQRLGEDRRRASGPAWRKARFTADSNPVLNIDAGLAGDAVLPGDRRRHREQDDQVEGDDRPRRASRRTAGGPASGEVTRRGSRVAPRRAIDGATRLPAALPRRRQRPLRRRHAGPRLQLEPGSSSASSSADRAPITSKASQ